MLNRILRTIERYRMFEQGQSIGVAVSGGADSVCLLHALLELAPRRGWRLTVLHLDHQLRGEESRQDAEFVREMATRLGLPVRIRQANLGTSLHKAGGRAPAHLEQAGGNLEQAGRLARLAFFREVLASGAVSRVALGHTRSDQAETVLFRFLRGSGTAGLAGIRPVTPDGMVRPLIEIERSEIRDFLDERGIAWREDSTNATLAFARNRIRHQWLPRLAAEWNPAIGETLANTADWALAEEAYWETEIDRLAAQHYTISRGGVTVRADALKSLPVAAARRLVRRAMQIVKSNLRGIDFGHIRAVLELASARAGSGRVQVPEMDICRSFGWLRFTPHMCGGMEHDYRLAAHVPGALLVPGTDLEICLELTEMAESPNYVYNGQMSCLDWRRLSGALELRNWRPGDVYQPSGNTGAKKIKTLFQRARIPLWERRLWPVLVDGASIVWARKFGPAAEFAAGPDSSLILRIRVMTAASTGETAGVANSESV